MQNRKTGLFPLFLILFLSWVSLTIQGSKPAPAPHFSDGVGSGSVEFSPPAPSPVSGMRGYEGLHEGTNGAPSPVLESKNYSWIPETPPPMTKETGSETVKWCAVRDEFMNCQYFVSLLRQTNGYEWKCVKRGTTQECLVSIKKGEADLINLEAGLAYIAFLNYSMKAIANEVYCNHAVSYDAVAVVNRKACHDKEGISLIDFKGRRSCNGGYSTAAGWNYPVNHLKQLIGSGKLNEQEMVTGFFSGVCAPSEFEGTGVCSGCGNENGSCHSNSLYSGHQGAFRCLVEELGDIAFVKGDTALLYSMEGLQNQTWSTKPISNFMYLCPQGGCREINGYPGYCSYGTIPANVIMASNSISRKKRSEVLQTLLNATWVDALYTGKNRAGHLLSSSVQGLAVVEKLTRSYLGVSASISESIQDLNSKKIQAIPSRPNSAPDVSSLSSSNVGHRMVAAVLSILIEFTFLAFSPW